MMTWQVTRVIYTDEIVSENDTDVTLHIPISLGNTIAIRILPLVELCDNPSSSSTRSSSDDGDGASEDDSPAEEYDEFKVNPHFQYLVLSQIDDPPIIKVFFHYPSTENDSCPDSLSISLLQYPNLWPAAEKDKWTEWISTKANDILQDTNMSSAVCDFLLHKVIGYFEAVDENSMHGYSAILFQSVGYHDEAWKLVNADKSRVVKDIRVKKKLPYDTPLIHKYARQALKRNGIVHAFGMAGDDEVSPIGWVGYLSRVDALRLYNVINYPGSTTNNKIKCRIYKGNIFTIGGGSLSPSFL